MNMKLDYKKTILVGFAFFLISAFWQAYDTIVPLILNNVFGVDSTTRGFIMSFDNILAVFMLPLFGGISDRVSTKIGKRTPFIIFGTVLAVTFFITLSYIQNASLLWLFIIILLLTLISMATFRSPAVALMPDVTVKPLRSKANAIINLMGTAGGMIVLALGGIFKTGTQGKTDFSAYIITVCAVMVAGLITFLLTVKENKWVKQMEEDTVAFGIVEEKEDSNAEKRKLSRSEFISLILILASVALWYIGYNAITSSYSVYATEVLNFNYSTTLLIAQAAAIVSYVPVGIVASKIGRKKTILTGVVLLASAFVSGIFLPFFTSEVVTYPIFALAGIGWATINVNSFPMVVELAKGGDVGKYTGFYYTASMSAQIVTPILSGVFIDNVGWHTLFPYAAIFVGLAFVTMFFVRHGDSKPTPKKSALESFDVDD